MPGSKTVSDVMHEGVIACKPDTPMQEVVRIVADTDVHAIVVMGEDGEVQGVISHFDIIGLYGQNLMEHTASEVMTPGVLAISPWASVVDAVQLMLERDVHRLLVAETMADGKQKPVGIVSTTDIVKDMRGAKWMWYMG
ncbi:MAG: cyclic nucleotide-binding/CBS domain-containing protein [Chloroflexota bacterium]